MRIHELPRNQEPEGRFASSPTTRLRKLYAFLLGAQRCDRIVSIRRMQEPLPSPKGEPLIRTIAMPAETNPSGDIFGGWLMAQMDLAAGNAAARRARGRCVTAAVD